MDQIEEENKHMGHPWSKLYEDIGFWKRLRLGLGFRVDKKVRLLGTGEKKCTWIQLKGREGGKTKQNPNGIFMVNYVRV